jgi:tRNA G46 methylase TrmB
MESLANALITTDWENFANWSVESATTQSFRRYFKKINHFGKDTQVVGKNPNKSKQAEHESETTDRCVPFRSENL